MPKETNQTTTVTISLETPLLKDIEKLRKRQAKRAGHISRSGIIRWLVLAGLESIDRGEAQIVS